MITRSVIKTTLLILLLCVSIVCRNGSAEMFFVGDAVAWVLALGLLVVALSGVHRIIAEGIFLLAINNLLDELLFDPTVTGINEWVFFAVVTSWTIYKIQRWRTTGKTKS